MDGMQLQMIAGSISTGMFVTGSLPMLYKAYRTKDLGSYSMGNIMLSNVGNLIHWIYVACLPVGPIWYLHGFNTLVAILMLAWYWRYEINCRLAELSHACVSNPQSCPAG